MLLSDSKRFAFIHVPKTGGDSVTASLLPWNDAGPTEPPSKKHWTARHILRHYFTADTDRKWSDYYTFGFVRNPWQHVHSDYWFCRGHAVPGREFGSWREKVIRARQQTFGEFVIDCCGEHGTNGRGLYETYLADGNRKQLVTDVLKLEELSHHWDDLCDALGVGDVPLERRNVTPNRPDYREDYNDRTKFLVSVRFADDIQRFNYSFERTC